MTQFVIFIGGSREGDLDKLKRNAKSVVSVGIGSNHKSKTVRLHPVALVDNFNPKRVNANRSGIAVYDAQTKRARQIKIPVDITYFKCACMQNGSSGVRTLPNRHLWL